MTTLPEDLRPISALLDAWYWFKLKDGEQSPRVHEAIHQLSAPEFRRALKAWYRTMDHATPAVDEFRRILEDAVGERLPLAKE